MSRRDLASIVARMMDIDKTNRSRWQNLAFELNQKFKISGVTLCAGIHYCTSTASSTYI